jgi:hypothetical protein
MREQGNVVRHTADKLDAKALSDFRRQRRGCQGRTNPVPRSFIESYRQDTAHQAEHPC